jgi:hypothetical protein
MIRRTPCACMVPTISRAASDSSVVGPSWRTPSAESTASLLQRLRHELPPGPSSCAKDHDSHDYFAVDDSPMNVNFWIRLFSGLRGVTSVT